jgi:thiol-disulfide isomerase/thioredoxin
MVDRNSHLPSVIYLALLASILGCGPTTNPAPEPTVSIKTLDYEGIQKLIADHKGKVVVMDCWSTSCGPCIQEFPKLVALHSKYDSKKLACISLSFDFEGGEGAKPEDVQPDVLKFLEKQKATFDNVLCSEDSDTLRRKMDLAAIPAVYVYGRDGILAKRFEGEGAYQEVPALVETLLAN